MNRISLLLTSLTLGTSLLAAEPESALDAAKALPKTAAKGFAGAVARGGAPDPEKWIILVQDENSISGGVREYTIAKGTVLSSKEGSDFAQILTEEMRINPANVRVDSPLAVELVASYAEANAMTPASFDYDLRQNGAEAAPLWTVTALDDAGARLGAVVIAANTGAVVSHDGFEKVPTPADLTADLPPPVTTEKKSTKSGSVASKSSSSSERKRPHTFRRIGGHLQKFFTGKNTIGR